MGSQELRNRKRNGAGGNHDSAPAVANDVQSKATEMAWQVPAKTLTLVLLAPVGAMLVRVGTMDRWIGVQLAVCSGLSVVAFFVTSYMVPLVAPKLIGKLSGVDIGKRGLGGPRDGERVPESLGIVSSTVFMVCVGILQFLFGSQNDQLLEYNAALLSICFATLLGLVDDIIDIRWKHKLIIGVLMSLPLLLSYKGTTSILVPKALSPYIESETSTTAKLLNSIPTVKVVPNTHGHLVELGILYYMYMSALVVFCTNAVNIYAGINGIEAGQSIVVGCSIAVMNLMDLAWRGGSEHEILSGDGRNHLFSLMLMLPFIASALGLLRFNFYPAQVFVGDVFPYYSGMTIAVAAILGHFSKSLLFLIIPQVINFLYSAPQLFHIIPIPRHRLPKINLQTGFLEPSRVAEGDPRSNMTLLCAALRIFGPMHERTLCVVLLAFQAVCAVVGISLRYSVSEMVFGST